MDRFKDQQKRVADNNDKKNELSGVKHLSSCDNLEVVLIKKSWLQFLKTNFCFVE